MPWTRRRRSRTGSCTSGPTTLARTRVVDRLAPFDIQNANHLPSCVGRASKTVLDARHDPTRRAISPCTDSRSVWRLVRPRMDFFRQVNELGQSSNCRTPDAGSAVETSLDVDMVSALAVFSTHVGDTG